jgi:hypothetical protein
MSNEKQLTARQFVAAGGMLCPRCGSGEVSLSEPRMEGQSMFEDGECTACGCEFYTILRLVGYGLQGDSFVDGQDNVFTITEDFAEIQPDGQLVVEEIKPTVPLTGRHPAPLSPAEELLHKMWRVLTRYRDGTIDVNEMSELYDEVSQFVRAGTDSQDQEET